MILLGWSLLTLGLLAWAEEITHRWEPTETEDTRSTEAWARGDAW